MHFLYFLSPGHAAGRGIRGSVGGCGNVSIKGLTSAQMGMVEEKFQGSGNGRDN